MGGAPAGSSVDRDLALRQALQTETGLGQLALAATDETGESDDFAGADVEGHAAHPDMAGTRRPG